jgi:hypothetical protein
MDTTITWENDYQLVQLSRQKKAKLEAKRFQSSQLTPNLSFKPRIKSEGSSTNWERSTPRDQIICHNCGLFGHMKRDCEKPRVVCHACGKEGHIRPDCPRKPPGGWPVKGRGRPGAGGRPSSGGGNNDKNNNGKRDWSSGRLNCTTLEEANNPEAAVIGTLINIICFGKLLFDTGATTSSISKPFANNLGMRCDTIHPLMTILTNGGKP